jgi:hypothetical protein
MNRIMRWSLLSLVVLLGPTGVRVASAQTVNAASCNASDVQAALNKVAADGTVVNIPAGTCTWTTAVTYNQVYSTIIQGQTTVTGNAVPGVPTGPYTVNDQTVITDDFAHGSATISITTATGKSFRMTGLTIVSGTSAAAFNGIVAVYGTSQSVRIDHNHFNAPRDGDHVVQFNTWTYGVVDHNEFDNGGNVFFLEFYSGGWYGLPDPNNYGQASWAVSENFGTNQFTYVENNYFAGGFAQDCNYGGRYVLRYNLVGYGSKLEIHGPSGSFPFRGCRAYELYGNTFDYVASPTASNAFAFVVQMESGTGLWWRNSITGYYQFLHADVVRTNNSTYAEPATPSGWGYCSATPVAGVLGPSPWDGNLPGQNGRPCLDGVGRGKGDLLTGAAFPNIVDSVTSTITWPNQASVPLYAWMNVFNPVPDSSSQYFAADAVTVENSDYYLELPNYNENTSFNGTAGMGFGLLSARPSTCTPHVAWWETDNNQLDYCYAANTWSTVTSTPASYVPYTYPHPLVTGSQTSGAPSAPTNLGATVN